MKGIVSKGTVEREKYNQDTELYNVSNSCLCAASPYSTKLGADHFVGLMCSCEGLDE